MTPHELQNELGHGNALPAGFQLVSQDDFWSTFTGLYHHGSWHSRWLTRELPEEHQQLHGAQLVCITDDRAKMGVGWVRRVEHAREVTPEVYFRFALCEHDFAHRSVGRCLHQYTCRNCGYGYTVDSSG